MVFYVTPGINADNMVARNGRLCKVQGPISKLERDIPPLGDNRNPIIYRGERISFPVLYNGKGNPSTPFPLAFNGGANIGQAKSPAPQTPDVSTPKKKSVIHGINNLI
jgi:hypothetical protein